MALTEKEKAKILEQEKYREQVRKDLTLQELSTLVSQKNTLTNQNASKSKQYVCTVCGYVGKPLYKVKGSVLIEILLWFFLIPGLIYSIWRLTSGKQWLCPTCNNDSLIPVDTPTGQKLVEKSGLHIP